MRFREHRGQLDDSMETLVELADHEALMAHAKQLLAPWGFIVTEVLVQRYMDEPDKRIGWPRTCLVTVPGYGVLGYTDELPK